MISIAISGILSTLTTLFIIIGIYEHIKAKYWEYQIRKHEYEKYKNDHSDRQ